MLLYLYYLPSFLRSTKRLGQEQKQIVGLILEALEIYLKHDCNFLEAKKIAPRFFYKQLRKPYYEAGIEGKLRIVFRREQEKVIAILAGNHDQIKQFLDTV